MSAGIAWLAVLGPGSAAAWALQPVSMSPTAAPSPDQSGTPVLNASFSGTASADGIRMSLKIPDFLIVENFLDGPGPSAQASLDSLGTSQAFASMPYPGETVVALPGLLSILTGKSMPSYPFYISTSNPTSPDSHVDQPGYHLAAHSDSTSSSASARSGEETTSGSKGGSFSTVSVSVEPDGTLVSRSGTLVDLTLGPIQLSGFEVTAKVERSPDGEVKRASNLRVSHLSLAGTPIGVTDHGLVVGSSALPLDALGAVSQMVSQGETTVQFLPVDETADSIRSAGLFIKTSLQLPVKTSLQLPVVNYPVDIGVTIGRAFAMGASSAFASPPPASLTPIGTLAETTGGFPAATVGLGVAGGAPGATGEVGQHARGPTAPAQKVVRRLPMTASKWTFYPILFLAALVLLVATLGSRVRKERWAWNS